MEGHLSTDFKWHLVLSQETTHECLCKALKKCLNLNIKNIFSISLDLEAWCLLHPKSLINRKQPEKCKIFIYIDNTMESSSFAEKRSCGCMKIFYFTLFDFIQFPIVYYVNNNLNIVIKVDSCTYKYGIQPSDQLITK